MGRLSRSALYAFGVGALSVATAAGCTHNEPMMTVYGGPPPDLPNHDGGVDAAKPTPPTPPTSPKPASTLPPAPVYGGPPPERHGD